MDKSVALGRVADMFSEKDIKETAGDLRLKAYEDDATTIDKDNYQAMARLAPESEFGTTELGLGQGDVSRLESPELADTTIAAQEIATDLSQRHKETAANVADFVQEHGLRPGSDDADRIMQQEGIEYKDVDTTQPRQ